MQPTVLQCSSSVNCTDQQVALRVKKLLKDELSKVFSAIKITSIEHHRRSLLFTGQSLYYRRMAL